MTKEDKEEFWEVVTSKLLLEKDSLDKIKETRSFQSLKSKAGLALPNWSSIVSGLQKPRSSPHISSSSSFPTPHKTIVHPPVMDAPARYAPLVLPAVLHELPSKYATRIPTWGSDEEISAEEFVDRFNDFIDKE